MFVFASTLGIRPRKSFSSLVIHKVKMQSLNLDLGCQILHSFVSRQVTSSLISTGYDTSFFTSWNPEVKLRLFENFAMGVGGAKPLLTGQIESLLGFLPQKSWSYWCQTSTNRKKKQNSCSYHITPIHMCKCVFLKKHVCLLLLTCTQILLNNCMKVLTISLLAVMTATSRKPGQPSCS